MCKYTFTHYIIINIYIYIYMCVCIHAHCCPGLSSCSLTGLFCCEYLRGRTVCIFGTWTRGNLAKTLVKTSMRSRPDKVKRAANYFDDVDNHDGHGRDDCNYCC